MQIKRQVESSLDVLSNIIIFFLVLSYGFLSSEYKVLWIKQNQVKPQWDHFVTPLTTCWRLCKQQCAQRRKRAIKAMDLTFPTLQNFPAWVIIGQAQTICMESYLPFITSSCTIQIVIGLNKRSSHLGPHLWLKIVQIYLNKTYILFNHRPKKPNEILRATITFSQKDLKKSLKRHVSQRASSPLLERKQKHSPTIELMEGPAPIPSDEKNLTINFHQFLEKKNRRKTYSLLNKSKDPSK